MIQHVCDFCGRVIPPHEGRRISNSSIWTISTSEYREACDLCWDSIKGFLINLKKERNESHV
jgi:hypothetical protein